MSTFKLDFSEENAESIEKWKYQDEELETKYKEFVTAKELEDEDTKEDKQGWLSKVQAHQDVKANKD